MTEFVEEIRITNVGHHEQSASETIHRLGAEGVTIAFEASPRLAAVGIAVALLTGLGAGMLPAWQAARTEIVPALRNV